MDVDIMKIAKEFKEDSAYILEGYLDMCQADLPRKKRCWLELIMDNQAYTDGKMVHLGLFTLKDVFDSFMDRYPDTDPVAFFAVVNEYLLGHENQHTRSTRNKDWEAGMIAVRQAILRYISKITGDHKIFRMPKDYDVYIEDLKKRGLDINLNQLGQLAHYIVNSIEDGRIERIRAIKRPGFGSIMRLVRSTLYEMTDTETFFDAATCDPATMPKEQALDILLAEVLSLSTCSVYTKNFFTLFAGTQVGADAHRLIPHIRAGVNSGTCRGIVAAAEGVAEVLAPYIFSAMQMQSMSETMQNAKSRMEQTGSGSSEEQHNATATEEETDEGESRSVMSSGGVEESLNEEGESAENKPRSKDLSGDGVASAGKGQEEASGSTPAKGGGSGNTEDSDNTVGQGENEQDPFGQRGGKVNPFEIRKAEGEAGDISDALDQAMRDAASAMAGISGQISARKADTKKKIAACKTTKLPEFKPVTAATVFPGVKFVEKSRNYELKTPMPYDLQVRADKFANDIEELFKNQEQPHVRCVNTGKIDATNIYKLGMNMIDCFEQEQEIPEFSGCAYFLCDNSGSMGYGKGSKRYYANTALAVIEQGFSKHMPIKMTAFDEAYNNIIHEVIKNWDEELPVSGAYNFAIKGRGGSGNADGYSIRVATEELLARPEEEKMLVVLSDGAPAKVTYNTPMRAEDEVRMAVEDARAAGVRVISIYFEESDWRSPEIFEYMYGKHESIVCDPDEVEDHLAALMQTFVFG